MGKPPEQTYDAASSIKIPYLRDGAHIAILPVADDLFDLIGRVTAYWGSFEFHFDQVLGALLVADEREAVGWQRSGFKRRKELLTEVVTSLYGDQPEVVRSFAAVCGKAADLHWRRNLIAHGFYTLTILPHSSTAVFRVEGEVKGRKISVSLNHATLEKLWHDVAHLSGSLKQAFLQVGETNGWWLTLPDTQMLQVYRETNHPWNPNPDKRTAPPQSSEG